MQTTTWSNEELREQFVDCITLKDVIKNVEGLAWNEGQVVCEVKVNGVTLSEAQEEELGAAQASEITELQILTRTPKELIGDAMRSYQDLLPEISQAALTCSESFREQDLHTASQQFSGVLEGCRWFTDAIRLLKSSIGDSIERWNLCELQYMEVVRDLLVAFESKDYSLVADLLEYELTNCLDGWSQLFESMGSESQGASI